MLSKRIFLSFLLVGLTQKTIIPLTISQVNTENKASVAWSQVCSCRSYYGVPHTCYYSSAYDPDYSCASKCIREANR